MLKIRFKKGHNFILGAATVLEIHPQTCYRRLLPKFSDAENLASDWSAIGKDFRVASVKILGPEYRSSLTFKIADVQSPKKEDHKKVPMELLDDRKKTPTSRYNRRKSRVAR